MKAQATHRLDLGALLDRVGRELRYALRSFRRAPLAAATIVATVGLGLGLVAAVFSILSLVVFRVDEVRNPHELYEVTRQPSAVTAPEPFTRAQLDALVRETDVFSAAFASTGDVDAWLEGTKREGRLVTGNFFQVLGVAAALGRALTPADDEPGQPPVLVLSHRAWEQHYASDPTVLDRPWRVNGATFRIAGIMPEGFRGLEPAAPDFWAPLSLLEEFGRDAAAEGSTGGLHIVGRLKPGVTQGQALGELTAWDSRQAVERSDGRFPATVSLEPRLGTVPRPAEALLVFMPLLFAFGLILLIGCANVANLLRARLVARQREIGIRLAIGASRPRVVWQLLTENLLLALVAAALAFLLSRLVLRGAVYAAIQSFPPEIGSMRIAVPPADWRLVLFLLAGAVVSTVLFALAPALRATRLGVARAIRGQALRDGRPGRVKDRLIVMQVAASALLLICAAIFLRGAWSAADVDPGLRTSDIVTVSVLDEGRRGAVVDALRTEPIVAAVVASWPAWLGGISGLPAYAEGSSGKSVVWFQRVSPGYFDALGVEVLRGRAFNEAERGAAEAVAVVSETVARELWPSGDALGQVVRIEPDLTLLPGAGAAAADPSDDPALRERAAVVVGIVRDVPGFRIAGTRLGGSGVYLPASPDQAGTAVIARVRGDLEQARRALVDRLAALDPNLAEVSTLKTIASVDTYILSISFACTIALGLLALVLTLSGLYGVLSFLVEQRRGEIGVRMALGASRGKINQLVLRQSARPVMAGALIGASLTLGLGALLLATPAAEQISATVRLFDPIAYASSLLFIASACAGAALIPALRAGRVNPLAALRED